MTAKAFVYTELQNSIPFQNYGWRAANPVLLQQPGLINKTWLSGIGTHSTGGLYEFDTIANAMTFATAFFPARARSLNHAQTTRVFDGAIVEEASRALNSMHFGGRLGIVPAAFVYTEAQISVPFDAAPWREMNPVLKAQPGLLHKTWLSGVNSLSVGGFYAFDTLEHATRFALDYFPTEAAALNVAYTTRIFDASVVAEASKPMRSPFVV